MARLVAALVNLRDLLLKSAELADSIFCSFPFKGQLWISNSKALWSFDKALGHHSHPRGQGGFDQDANKVNVMGEDDDLSALSFFCETARDTLSAEMVE